MDRSKKGFWGAANPSSSETIRNFCFFFDFVLQGSACFTHLVVAGRRDRKLVTKRMLSIRGFVAPEASAVSLESGSRMDAISGLQSRGWIVDLRVPRTRVNCMRLPRESVFREAGMRGLGSDSVRCRPKSAAGVIES